MDDAVAVAAVLAAAVNLVAGLFGAWRWWTVAPSRAFWVLARAGQAAAVALAAVAGVAAATGFHPADGLFWLYALLPVAIGFFAEQFRAVAAQAELDRRGLADAQAVGSLPAEQQQFLVRAILHRELGVMAIAAGVVVVLAWRAAVTAAGL